MPNFIIHGGYFFNVDYIVDGTYEATENGTKPTLTLFFVALNSDLSGRLTPHKKEFYDDAAKEIHKRLIKFGVNIPIKRNDA